MPDTPQTLLIEPLDGAVTLIHLNRPDAANALNTQTGRGLAQAFAHIAQSGAHAVVLAGKGRNFCAGADLKERKGMSETQWHAQHDALEAGHRAIVNCPLPVIAAVQGAAFGGGLEIALACDFIYAGHDARFALTETTLGIMPGLGGTQTLPRRIGHARAAELTYAGRPFSAAEAHAWGLVNQLFPPAQLLEGALAAARRIAQNAPLALRAVKAALREGAALPLEEALKVELAHYNTLLATNDRREGIAAFNEKRRPAFTGS